LSQYLNSPGDVQTHARKPRVRVLVNGTAEPDAKASFSGGSALGGVIDVDLTSNNWYVCDRFNLTLALVRGSQFDANWWSSQTDIALTVQLGYLPEGRPEGGANIKWTTLVQGGADQVAVDPAIGTVTVEGRDLSYLLIESRTQEEFLNHTSSQVVTELARRHGLTPVVTATKGPVDRFYAADHTKTTLGTFHRQVTEWDLCVFLAQREGFDLYVVGRELHFQPKTLPDATPWVIRYQPPRGDVQQRMNVQSLRMSRSLIIAKDIQVTVRSWNSKDANPVVAVAKKTGFGKVSAAGSSRAKGGAFTGQNFVYVYPGLTKDQAQQRAEQRLKELSQHERVIEFDAPGSLDIDPRTTLLLTGTGTTFDQRYHIDHIRRRISYDHGFSQSVRAKNQDSSSQITVE
jgi:hypothetical protein